MRATACHCLPACAAAAVMQAGARLTRDVLHRRTQTPPVVSCRASMKDGSFGLCCVYSILAGSLKKLLGHHVTLFIC